MCAQPGYPSNCYSFETTATRELGHFLEELNPKLSEVMKAVGCRDGVAWAEFMLDTDGHFYILEMGHRMNGEMTFLAYPKAHGFDVIKWITDIALGVKHTKEDLPVGLNKCAQTSANVYAFWTKEEATITAINGLDYFRTLPDTYVNLAVQCGDTVEQFRHIGTVIFNSESREMTKRIVHEINTRVTMASTDTENILIQYEHDDCIDTI